MFAWVREMTKWDWGVLVFVAVVALGFHRFNHKGHKGDDVKQQVNSEGQEAAQPIKPDYGPGLALYSEPRRTETCLPAMSAAELVTEQRAAQTGTSNPGDTPSMRIVVDEQKAAEEPAKQAQGDQESP